MFTRLLPAVLDTLLPQRCLLCRKLSHRPVALCLPCETALPLNHPACECCAAPLAAPDLALRYCPGCLWRPSPISSTHIPWRYLEPMSTLVQHWKFGPEPGLTPLLAQLFEIGLRHCGMTPVLPDLLIPVPLHWRRLWRRGHNQSALLAWALTRALPRLSSVPVAPRAVQRKRATPSQRGLLPQERHSNLRQAFRVTHSVTGLHVAVVDDVMTTGATVNTMAQELLAAGARRVDVWALARTP